MYNSYIHYTVPTSQSEVTVMQSDDDPSRQGESCQVKHNNGMQLHAKSTYACMSVFGDNEWVGCLALIMYVTPSKFG